MILLFEIFGLNDCAIELIDGFEEVLSRVVDLESLRSALTEEAAGVSDYATYIQNFEARVREGRIAAFPDGYLIASEGYLMSKEGEPGAVIFRAR